MLKGGTEDAAPDDSIRTRLGAQNITPAPPAIAPVASRLLDV